MKEKQFSLTAMMCAYLRAAHAKHGEPKIFDDFLAEQLIPDENRLRIEEGLIQYLQLRAPEHSATFPDKATALKRITETMNSRSNLLSRSRYTEEALEAAVKEGARQYVILGAGLDTFAFRRRDMLDKLRVFELDHPATQCFKTDRIAELGWAVPEQLNFISMDFTQEDLAVVLKESSYDPTVKSFFSWIGVTMYLSREDVFKTLRAIADVVPSGSAIVFDYFDLAIFDPQKVDLQMKEEMARAQQAGEPMQTALDPSTLAADLASAGFRLQEDLDQADIQKRYSQGRKYAHIVQAWVE